MKKEIMNRIDVLGGKHNFTGGLLQKDFESISFDKIFLEEGFTECLDDAIISKISNGIDVKESEITYPSIEFMTCIFTPFTKGTEDFEEWKDILDENAIRKVINIEPLEFMFIGYSEGFPNHYFINIYDENTDNPTVYTTDHEVYFDEIEEFGTLEDFFNIFVSEEDFQTEIEKVKNNFTKSNC